MNILLLEANRETAGHVAEALRNCGYGVEAMHSGLLGLSCAKSEDYGAIILKRALPDLDGLDFVRQLRAEGHSTPILFLAAASDLHDRVEGLESGADDYVVKPFAISELLARLRAITRRSRSREVTRLQVGELEIDLIHRAVHREGKQINLQPREFRLLEFLLRMAGRVVTRAMLLEQVWDIHFDPHTNVVETHISRLRKKIDFGYADPLIRTVRGFGYVLSSELPAKPYCVRTTIRGSNRAPVASRVGRKIASPPSF